jgi:cytochrome P450
MERGHGLSGLYPPGPKRSPLSAIVYFPGRNPLAFFAGLVRKYGDLVHLFLAREHLYVVNHPAHVRDILVTNQRSFKKGRGLEGAKRLLGEGLLTSEGQVHLRQRRLIQPAFHRERLLSYASTMTEHAGRLRDRWVDGARVDAAQEMMRLTLGIVGKTLFGTDVEAQAPEVGRALTAVMTTFWMTMLPFYDDLEKLPIPALARGRRARAELDRIIYGMIAERRRHQEDRGDLLSMLLMAQDVEGDGSRMTDTQVRDEAMTIFLAGHETTANALSWTWFLLSEHPAVEARMHDEIDRVLGGRLPTMDDLPRLPVVEQVVTEAMRLYPPAWIIGRRALVPYEIGGYRAPTRSVFVFSPYIIQRDARWYVEPDQFVPERWTAEFKASLPPFAYLPFGGGQRRCIGDQFAWTELSLVLATIAQRWTLRLVPGHPVAPQAVVTLRLKHGLKMTLHNRDSGFGTGTATRKPEIDS